MVQSETTPSMTSPTNGFQTIKRNWTSINEAQSPGFKSPSLISNISHRLIARPRLFMILLQYFVWISLLNASCIGMLKV